MSCARPTRPLTSLLLGLGALLLLAPARAEIGPPIEHPEFLRRVANRLQALEGGAAQRVRITHFGDSHIAADLLTAPIRSGLQARFGDGGRGFLLAGRPWAGYRQVSMRAEMAGLWRTDGLRGGLDDGWFGPGGCSSAGIDPTARIELEGGGNDAAQRFTQVDVHFLRQPSGGCLEVRADGVALARVSTAGPWLEAGFARVRTPEGARGVSLHPMGGGEVRVFGASFEGPVGVVWDALGINGAHANRLLRADADGFAAGLSRLAPDLVVLSYGTNELFSGDLDVARNAAQMDEVLTRIRRAVPNADCLLTGPPDFLRKGKPVPETPALYHAHRRLAEQHGCAFWDAQSAMGGPTSVKRWRRQGLAQRDYVHLTRDGYVRLGDMLLSAILGVVDTPP